MKRKNRTFANNIKYFENETAKKALKNIKISNNIFYFTFIFLTITYILLMMLVIKMTGLIFITLVYFAITIDLTFAQKRYFNRIMKETINKTICPEAYINLNLYNANRLICNERMYKQSLNNIAYGYILLGDFGKADKIIKYVDSKKKDLILQSQVLKNKIEIAFLNENNKECEKQCENLEKILKFIPKKHKKEARLNINLTRAIDERNIEKIEELCNTLEKKRKKFYKINAAYYRGLIYERNNMNEYEDYYKFVAENGNNIIIAKKAREKLGVTNVKNVYNKSNHIMFKIFKILVLMVSITTAIFWSMYTIYIVNA